MKNHFSQDKPIHSKVARLKNNSTENVIAIFLAVLFFTLIVLSTKLIFNL